VIKLVNKIAPEFTGNTCKNDTICQYPTDCGSDAISFCATAKDDCTPDDQLKYSYFVDLNNDGTRDFGGNTACVTISKSLGLKYGRHMITWSVEDNCGNVKTCSKTFIIKDCKKPTPVAKLLAIELMPNNCQATLEAAKLNNFSWDNCTPMSNLRFRLAKLGEYSANMTLDQVLSLNDYVVFGAGEIGSQTVALFVIDADNNWDFVETFVLVQSVMNPDCNTNGNTAIVSGTVQTEAKENMDNVDIKVNGISKYKTDAQGIFNLILEKNKTYNITAEKLIEPRNGVTTADLVAINKHVLAIESLNSPYKRIAADINNDSKISTADMVELRKLILFISDGFSNNTSWKLLDKNYSFTTATPEKENYTKSFTFDPLTKSLNTNNFIGVKIGDVNGSAKANNLIGNGEERNELSYNFVAENTFIKAGETKTIELKLDQSANLAGYQFTLNFDPAQLEIIHASGLKEDNFGFALLNEGALTISTNDQNNQSILLTLKAKKNLNIENGFSIGSRFTKAEAYTISGDLANISLKFSGLVDNNNFQLFQNKPNPFNQKTIIGFILPESTNATLTIYDAVGKIHQIVNGNYTKGYNEIDIDRSKLPTAGIFTYRLTTSNNSATKQLFITE